MLAEARAGHNATGGGDIVVAARGDLMRAHVSVRRAVVVATLVSTLLVTVAGGSVPWPLLFITLAFGAGTELEFVLARRARTVTAFERTVVAIRVLQLPLMAAGLYLLVGALAVPLALALTLVGSAGLVRGAHLLVITVAASVVNVGVPGLLNWAGAPIPVFEFPATADYGLTERLLASLLMFPMIAFLLHRRGRGLVEVQERLAQAIEELRLAQWELEESQRELKRLNVELSSEVERQSSALAERNRYLTIINAISFALAEPLDDTATVDRAVRLVARLLGARCAQAAHCVTDEGEAAHLFVTMAPEDIQAPRLPESLLHTVTDSGRPLTSDDGQWTDIVALPDIGEPYAVVPLVAKGRSLGSLALIGARGLQWGEQERRLLQLIGREMGTALENVRLYREALALARQQRFLADLSHELQDDPGDRGFGSALQLIADYLGTRDLALIRLPSGRGNTSLEQHLVAQGGSAEWLPPLTHSLASLVSDRTTPLVLGHGGEAPVSTALAAQDIGTLVVAPVVTRPLVEVPGGDALGVARYEQRAILIATRSHGARWGEAATDLIERVSGLLAQRLQTDHLTKLQQRRISELAALANVARVMQSGSDVDRLCAGFADALNTLLPYRRLYLAHLDEFGELVSVFDYAGGGRLSTDAPFHPADRSHRWFSLRSAYVWRPADEAPPSFVSAGDGRVLVVPMRPKGQVRGLVVAITDEWVSDAQAGIVEQAVEQLALALDNATLYHQATARASRIQTLSNLARIVASIVDLREAFAAFAEEVRWLIPFDRAVMLLIDESGDIVRPYATYPDGEVLTEPMPVAGSIASALVEGDTAFSVSRSDERYAHLDWSVFGPDVNAVAAVPVRQGTRTAAIFAVVQHAENSYAALDLDGLDEVAGLLGVTIERLRLYERAEYSARHDQLTDLPNYRYLQERLGETAPGLRTSGETAVLQIDMDNLKPINDSLGHEAGDRLIRAVAHRLRAVCGEQHFVARSGGDEFAIVMEGAGANDALQVADEIHASMRDAHLDVPGAPVRVGVSIGIAVAPHDGSSPAELMHAADLAMYEAKFGGGTRTSLASDRSNETVHGSTSRRSHRIAETLVRSLMNGATADERSTLAIAQRWLAAAMIGAGMEDDLIAVTRMLVALEALPHVHETPGDYERHMAEFLVGSIRAEWRESSDGLRRTLVRSIVPAAVALAWQRQDAGGFVERDFERVARHWGIQPDDALWSQFVTAVQNDWPGQRRRPAA